MSFVTAVSSFVVYFHNEYIALSSIMHVNMQVKVCVSPIGLQVHTDN